MATEYQVGKAVGRCTVSGREIVAGESFFTALFDSAEGIERRDYAAECWSEPPDGALCTFRTRIAGVKPRSARLFVDDKVLVQVFRKLVSAGEPGTIRFRFALALILMRKRLVKHEGTIRNDWGEVWRVRLAKEPALIEIPNPNLDAEGIARLSQDLTVVMADFQSIDDDDGSDADAAVASEVNDTDAPADSNAGDASQR